MSAYILNKNQQDSESGSNYEVHNLNTCNRLPNYENRISLGEFANCQGAMAKAREIWSAYPEAVKAIDGCYYCCEPCHKK